MKWSKGSRVGWWSVVFFVRGGRRRVPTGRCRWWRLLWGFVLYGAKLIPFRGTSGCRRISRRSCLWWLGGGGWSSLVLVLFCGFRRSRLDWSIRIEGLRFGRMIGIRCWPCLCWWYRIFLVVQWRFFGYWDSLRERLRCRFCFRRIGRRWRGRGKFLFRGFFLVGNSVLFGGGVLLGLGWCLLFLQSLRRGGSLFWRLLSRRRNRLLGLFGCSGLVFRGSVLGRGIRGWVFYRRSILWPNQTQTASERRVGLLNSRGTWCKMRWCGTLCGIWF